MTILHPILGTSTQIHEGSAHFPVEEGDVERFPAMAEVAIRLGGNCHLNIHQEMTWGAVWVPVASLLTVAGEGLIVTEDRGVVAS